MKRVYPAFRRGITVKKPVTTKLLLTIAGVGVSALARLLSDQGLYGVPFVTYIPVIMLVTVFCGWEWGALSALLSMVVVGTYFPIGAVAPSGTARIVTWVAATITVSFLISLGHWLRRTIIDLDLQTNRVEQFNLELQHRSRNVLQVVRALASQAKSTTDPDAFYQALLGRLDAMTAAAKLLGTGEAQPCEVRTLIETAMQPFSGKAITIDGPNCLIGGEPGRALIMALHELATNAVKHGAWSREGGSVHVGWTRSADQIELRWEETGGPEVEPPQQPGIGSRLLTPNMALPTVELQFLTDGVVCTITAGSVSDLSCSNAGRPSD